MYELETEVFTVKTIYYFLFIEDVGWGVPLGTRGQFFRYQKPRIQNKKMYSNSGLGSIIVTLSSDNSISVRQMAEDHQSISEVSC